MQIKPGWEGIALGVAMLATAMVLILGFRFLVG